MEPRWLAMVIDEKLPDKGVSAAEEVS